MYTFREIWGNRPLITHLKTAASGGRISHAYLFLGGEGAGKKLLANTFAKALECEGEDAPCGRCRSCRVFDSGNHPDVIYVRGEKKILGVDEVREQILETVDLKPYRYPYKIYIIEKADSMNVQAQNALLKTLEEPPAYAVFLLLAEQAEKFLPTVLSRVVTMKISPLSEKEVGDYLAAHTEVSETEAAVYAAYARGRIGQALSLIRDEDFQSMRKDILEKLEALPKLTEGEAVFLAKELEEYKDDLRFLDMIELWYRDLLTAKCLKDDRYLIQKDKKEAIFRCASEPAEKLAGKAKAVELARKRLMQNANFRLTMEVMLMDLKETESNDRGSRNQI